MKLKELRSSPFTLWLPKSSSCVYLSVATVMLYDDSKDEPVILLKQRVVGCCGRFETDCGERAHTFKWRLARASRFCPPAELVWALFQPREGQQQQALGRRRAGWACGEGRECWAGKARQVRVSSSLVSRHHRALQANVVGRRRTSSPRRPRARA